MTTISIVVPSLNQDQYIEACLRSILSQDHSSTQLIVVDGQSTDNTLDVLRRYEDQISHLIVEPDQGQADALRKGFALATGDIQCYLNSDDYLLPGTLAFVADYFSRHRSIDALYSNRIVVNATDEVIDCWILPRHSNYLMERWDYIPQETCFWRRTTFDRSDGIDAELEFAMDYDLFIQLMRAGRMVHVQKFLAAFRDHDQSKTHTLNDTVGKREVSKLQDRYGITLRPHDRLIGGLLRRMVEYRSHRYLSNHGHSLLQRIQASSES